jgi:hypothetical protein
VSSSQSVHTQREEALPSLWLWRILSSLDLAPTAFLPLPLRIPICSTPLLSSESSASLLHPRPLPPPPPPLPLLRSLRRTVLMHTPLPRIGLPMLQVPFAFSFTVISLLCFFVVYSLIPVSKKLVFLCILPGWIAMEVAFRRLLIFLLVMLLVLSCHCFIYL